MWETQGSVGEGFVGFGEGAGGGKSGRVEGEQWSGLYNIKNGRELGHGLAGVVWAWGNWIRMVSLVITRTIFVTFAKPKD